MKKIAMIGEYPASVMESFRSLSNGNFSIIEVHGYDEYDKLNDVDYIILRTLKMDRETIMKLGNVRLIHRWGAGYDTVDIKAAEERGISVAITAGVNSWAVSELAVLLMLAVYRHLVDLDTQVKRGEWNRDIYLNDSHTIYGKTVGIVGCGNIGKKVAVKVQAFGARTVYFDTFRMPESTEKKLNLEFMKLDDLLAVSDIVSLHLPAIPETEGFVDDDFFRKMKRGSVLINSARGSLIKEDALITALKSGQLGGAGLDTIVKEPVLKDDPLLSCDNIVITPHIGAATIDISSTMVECVWNNIQEIEAGRQIKKPFLVSLT